MSTDSSTAKKVKTNEEAELDILKNYILECPHVSKDSRAIQVALQGLEQEQKRMERDAKLVKKFSAASTAERDSSAITASSTGVPTAKTPSGAASKASHDDVDDAALMEWQDVTPTPTKEDESALHDSHLGKELAQSSIASMAQANTRIKSPLAAIALALHAALRDLNFSCTGIPSDDSSSSTKKTTSGGGFAAPIRDLPKNQLLPNQWDQHADDSTNPHVNLRYRKNGVGAVLLEVAGTKEDGTFKVQLMPATNKEPPGDGLVFPLDEHINLDSLSAALSGSPNGVLPALHYKALPVLMTNFCNAFDLGNVHDDDDTGVKVVSTSIPPPVAPGTDNLRIPSNTTGADMMDRPGDHDMPTVDDFQPQFARRRGDFNGDLAPGGLVDPNLGPIPPSQGGGNLMGPNHPIFQGEGFDPALPRMGGGMGMMPRYDPVGPPGGPTDPRFVDPNHPSLRGGRGRGRGPRRPPPGGSGDPNPDHARPPPDNTFL